jgi:hypothetical protein
VCDACGARQDWSAGTVALARTKVKSTGWHHINPKRDICPDCWLEGKR